jgi:hypothetical protein
VGMVMVLLTVISERGTCVLVRLEVGRRRVRLRIPPGEYCTCTEHPAPLLITTEEGFCWAAQAREAFDDVM